MARKKNETTTDLQRQSILELRKIWGNFTDLEFAAWYCSRWKIPTREVMGVLDAAKGTQ